MSDHHLLLIDISGFIRRAYHTGGNQFRSDGLPTWAITGTMGLLWRLLGSAQHDQPTLAAACFDAPGRTFRNDLFGEYKNNRPARDLELSAQLPFVYHAVEAMGIAQVEAPGFEADDVLATLASRAIAAGIRTTIVSSDKDLMQMVGPLVTVVDPKAHMRFTEAEVRGIKFGVEPRQVPDYQALAGDSVDNIPGIDGIGPKSAAPLIRMFNTIEGVVAAVRDGRNNHFFTPGQRVRLKELGVLERLQLYRTLAILRCDVPLEVKLEDLVLRPIMREHVDKILAKLEATGRFEAIFATAPQMQRVVEPLSDEVQMEWWAEELVIAGQTVPDLPQCGYYERRLTPKGVFVPAVVWREDDLDPITGEKTGQQILRCQVGEEPRDPVQEWSRLFRSPITREKYEFEMADRRWAAMHAPSDPKAMPNYPIDRTAIPAVHCSQPVSQKRKKRL